MQFCVAFVLRHTRERPRHLALRANSHECAPLLCSFALLSCCDTNSHECAPLLCSFALLSCCDTPANAHDISRHLATSRNIPAARRDTRRHVRNTHTLICLRYAVTHPRHAVMRCVDISLDPRYTGDCKTKKYTFVTVFKISDQGTRHTVSFHSTTVSCTYFSCTPRSGFVSGQSTGLPVGSYRYRETRVQHLASRHRSTRSLCTARRDGMYAGDSAPSPMTSAMTEHKAAGAADSLARREKRNRMPHCPPAPAQFLPQ